MKVIRGWDLQSNRWPSTILTIGNFDGVHRGHQVLIRTVVELARQCQGTALVMTFDPHPLKVLRPASAPRLIQTLEQRLEHLEHLGIDAVWLAPFTRDVAEISAWDFASNLLARRLQARRICLGRHFVFGKDRQGDLGFLRQAGAELGFAVQEVDELRFRGFRISSSRIRQFLADGRVALAGRCLGRPFALRGTVVHGDGLGKSLGFPTANLDSPHELFPATGVYVTSCGREGRFHPSLTNVGYRPTVTGTTVPCGRPTVEAHLLNFTGDLYGYPLEVRFHFRLRGERRFAGVDALSAQVDQDRRRALRYFSRVNRMSPRSEE